MNADYPPKAGEALNPQEIDVLNMLKEGYSQPLAAEMLGRALGTTKNQALYILIKLDAPNMVNAAYKAAKAGLI